jgi:hypothetical protein
MPEMLSTELSVLFIGFMTIMAALLAQVEE